MMQLDSQQRKQSFPSLWEGKSLINISLDAVDPLQADSLTKDEMSGSGSSHAEHYRHWLRKAVQTSPQQVALILEQWIRQ